MVGLATVPRVPKYRIQSLQPTLEPFAVLCTQCGLKETTVASAFALGQSHCEDVEVDCACNGGQDKRTTKVSLAGCRYGLIAQCQPGFK